MQLEKGKRLKHGTINKIAADFGVTRLTVSRFWHAAQKQYSEGKICLAKKKEGDFS